MFGPMNPFQKYMAKTMSSIATRGAAVDAAVATLESGHNRHCNKLKKLEKRADKNDSEQAKMKQSILAMQRREASTMVRIKGSGILKAKKNEDTTEVFIKVLRDNIGVVLDKKDFISVWRENPRKNNNLIARFVRSNVGSPLYEILGSQHKKTLKEKNIHVYRYQTPHDEEIHFKARQLYRKHAINQCWTNQAAVTMVVVTRGAPPIAVKELADLETLGGISPNPNLDMDSLGDDISSSPNLMMSRIQISSPGQSQSG